MANAFFTNAPGFLPGFRRTRVTGNFICAGARPANVSPGSPN
jgi:hypothetical protein